MKTQIRKLLLLTIILTAYPWAHARTRRQPQETAPTDMSLKAQFDRLNNSHKGPLYRNHMKDGTGLQAAFRKVEARQLGLTYDFWLGNFFATDYYELVGEYVHGDVSNPEASHSVRSGDHQALVQTPAALPRASSMLRNMVLEKYYIFQWPGSHLTNGLLTYGASGSEDEELYAKYFFNYYLTALQDEYQYLPAFLLVKVSPIGNGQTSSLEQARNAIASAPNMPNRDDHSQSADLGRIRNAVHNLISKEVIKMIDQYTARYHSDGQLSRVRSILVDYYSISSSKIADKAKNLAYTRRSRKADWEIVPGQEIAAQIYGLATALIPLKAYEVTADQLLTLSEAGVMLRDNLKNVPYETRAENFSLLGRMTQYLNSRLTDLAVADSPAVAQAILNDVYIEGFLTKKQYTFFREKVKAATDLKTAMAALEKAPQFAIANLTKAFNQTEEHPALQNWIQVEPKMDDFIDNTIKASSINTLSVMANKFSAVPATAK